MSERFRIQDATGRIVDYMPVGAAVVYFMGSVEADGKAGYANGCLAIVLAATASTTPRVFVNIGTNASSVWEPIDTRVNTALGFIPLLPADWRLVASNDVAALAAVGGVLAVDSAPKLIRTNTSTDKALNVQWAASSSVEIYQQFYYPPDMDVTATYTLNFRVSKNTNTDATCTFTADLFEGIGDTTRGGATAVLAQAALTTYTRTITPTTGHPNFAVCILTPGTHTTDVISMPYAYVLYKKKALTT